jgi:hypothetical protein
MEKNLILYCIGLLILSIKGQNSELILSQNISSSTNPTPSTVDSINYANNGLLLTSVGSQIIIWNRGPNNNYVLK